MNTRKSLTIAFALIACLALGLPMLMADNNPDICFEIGDITPCVSQCDVNQTLCEQLATSTRNSCVQGCGSNTQCLEQCADDWVADSNACEQQHISCLGACTPGNYCE